ncbi:hypothetical protein A7U60_g4513 [Sanghuangporus baumii]|uniref:Adipose-regulatory protein-domain-containing protein n=1 Tax=Sanghuangporus baumii TaxID=108892 RepID=A0A9Q5HYL2_SANBA|nr:hypothetical protein A7U60_g4513 [Sanghuangporus baumii]
MASTNRTSQAPSSLYDSWAKHLSAFTERALPILLLFSFVAGWIVWSTVPIGWRIPVYLQYGAVPYADVEVASLSTTQPYEISLQLTLPANDANYALGNFMTSLTITTLSNVTLADIRRPAIVLPPSPNFLPFSRPAHLVQLTVPLASSLITGVNRVKAHIELGRKDGWRSLGQGEGREVSVYTATLNGMVRSQGLRRAVAAAPLSFAVVAGVVFFVVTSLILAGCLLPSVLQSEHAEEIAKVKPEEAEPISPAEEPSITSRLRRRSSRVKEESDEEESFLSVQAASGSGFAPVRRRSRRSSTHDSD